jgi:signal transduction histidine kinase
LDAPSVIFGFGLGAAAAAGAAWAALRRHVVQVRAAERRARQAERMAEIGAMTGGLAHEIKNPLSTIGLNAQLLVEGLGALDCPDDERSRLLSRSRALQRETERLRGILQDFLEFAGQVHLEPRDEDLNQIVAELADFFLPEAERHGVRLRTDLSPGPLRARVDARALKQALLNLMLNAVQAMSPGGSPAPGAPPGELVLRTRVGKDAERAGPGAAGPRRVARVGVIDNGPGMTPETLAQIFKPYFTTRSGGSGLGLPTSRRLIEEHGGRIAVESEPGKGTEFTVVLPLE